MVSDIMRSMTMANMFFWIMGAIVLFPFIWILLWWNPSAAVLNEEGARDQHKITMLAFWNWLLTMGFLLVLSLVFNIVEAYCRPTAKKEVLELVGTDERECVESSKPKSSNKSPSPQRRRFSVREPAA